MILYKLDYVIEKTLNKASDERQVLHKLANVKLSDRDAAKAWTRILDHKWYMSERMGRDVGLRVAAIDYFENVEPVPTPRRAASRGGLPARLRMMEPLMKQAHG